MIVLRLTIGTTAHDIRSESRALIVGSDPTADVTLAHPDLAPRALQITREGSEVAVELLGTDKRALLRVGDEIELAGVGVALLGLLPPGEAAGAAAAGLAFGGYDDDLPPRADAPATAPPARTFELSDTTTSGERAEPPAVDANADARSAAEAQAAAEAEAKAKAREAARARAQAKARAEAQRRPTPQELAASRQQVRFPAPDFGTELVEQLKKSPFYAISIGFHVFVFFILSLIYTTDDRPLRDGAGAVKASMAAEAEELGEEVEEIEIDGLPKEPAELPDLEEPDLRDLAPPEAATPPNPSPLRIDDDVLEDPDPPQIGLMPSLRAANRQVRPRKPKMPKVDAAKTFTKGAAGQSNQDAAKIVRAQLGKGRFGKAVTLDDLDEDDILVVGGSFDHIEKTLDALRIKYVKKAPWALTSPTPETFKDHKIVFWNCGESLGRRRMAAVGKRLQAFVRAGGYVFTTDWGVANVLPYAFPGYIRTNGNRAHLPEMVLQIEPARSARNHPLLEGVFLPGVKGKWWLEQASFDMSVGRADAVTILIECPALREQFNRSPAVAATFHYGRGRVLHAMGHYFQEAGNIAGTIAVHRLALNFVLMRLEQDRKARAR